MDVSSVPFQDYASSVGATRHTERLLAACLASRATSCSRGGWAPMAVAALLAPRARVITSLTAVASYGEKAVRCMTLRATAAGGQTVSVECQVPSQHRLEAQVVAVNTLIATTLCYKDCGDGAALDEMLAEANAEADVDDPVLLGISTLCAWLAAACAGVPLWRYLKRTHNGGRDDTPSSDDVGPPYPSVVVPGTDHLRVPSPLRATDVFAGPLDEVHAVLYFTPEGTAIVPMPPAHHFIVPGEYTTVTAMVRAAQAGHPTAVDVRDTTGAALFGVHFAAGLGVEHVVLPFPCVGSAVPLYNEWVRVAESVNEGRV